MLFSTNTAHTQYLLVCTASRPASTPVCAMRYIYFWAISAYKSALAPGVKQHNSAALCRCRQQQRSFDPAGNQEAPEQSFNAAAMLGVLECALKAGNQITDTHAP
eukprot:1161829-Pelagomonas_calceolata.AAC.13